MPVGLTVDDINGLVLTVDVLSGEEAATLKEWGEPIAAAVGAQVLVRDDANGVKIVANALGLEHQVCKAHVQRNTDALIENLKPAAEHDTDSSLAAIGVLPKQAVADLERLEELIHSHQPETLTLV